MSSAAPQTPVSPLEVLQQRSLLRVLPPATVEEVVALGAWRTYQKGDILYRVGDAADLVWFGVRGWVRLYRTNREGIDRVLAYRGPGGLVGEDGLLNPPLHNHAAGALDEATCLVLSRSSVRALLQRHPLLCRELLRHMVGEQSRLQQDLVDVSITDTRQKLASTLLSLGERYGYIDPRGACHLQVPMTQQELASLVRAARETVSRLCAALSGIHIDGTSLTLEQWAEFKAQHG